MIDEGERYSIYTLYKGNVEVVHKRTEDMLMFLRTGYCQNEIETNSNIHNDLTK